ncbi:hypothetical protein A3A74_06575 [Candidatus Roizmanbacteria bacterium RIFCSPLOWO2_01_FULL_35_13]|uniref:Uncharacterized protein n=1 Tax=Candidatus Roizmanbacteria bacterium RIFCSPLOWO2_01_FULL_35_13 TaxID=1802055 RepID=A0A1F7I864_9BACT|nr:MAG: hypothetical protein A3A74_06575 [Candidatus Roizmanbacteria bacterium RIFCSPLOWO2_01_FULL_35_13]
MGSLEEMEMMVRKGEWAVTKGADTNKKNLIAYLVSFLFRRGQLEDYVNTEGDFIKNSGELDNVSNYESLAKKFRK